MSFLGGFDPVWIWLVLGIVLLCAELLVPGIFLMWMGVAALATALIVGLADVPMGWQILIFVVFSVFSAWGARQWLSAYGMESADPLMNDRGGRLVGQRVVVTSAIEGGSGRVKHGDSEWIASGDDAPVGARLVVTGHDGAMLLVAPDPASHIEVTPKDDPPALS